MIPPRSARQLLHCRQRYEQRRAAPKCPNGCSRTPRRSAACPDGAAALATELVGIALEPSSAARGSASPHQSAGANMHCNVGLAILEKVGPISASLLGGTHCVSIVGTPFSLIPRSSASRRSASSTMTTAWSCRHEHTASGCAHRPTMCGAHWRTKSLRRSGNGAVGRASAADATRPTRTATVARL